MTKTEFEKCRELALSLHLEATNLLIYLEKQENIVRTEQGLGICEDRQTAFVVLSSLKERVEGLYGLKAQ